MFLMLLLQIKGICTMCGHISMLVAFRGSCKFKMFIPKKLAKYRVKKKIKKICLTDCEIGYVHNAYIYVGKDWTENICQKKCRQLVHVNRISTGTLKKRSNMCGNNKEKPRRNISSIQCHPHVQLALVWFLWP